MEFRTGVLGFRTLFLHLLRQGVEGMTKEEKKELEGIQYIQKKNNLRDIKSVLILYNKLMEKELFHTQVGIDFMDTLKQRLIQSEEISNQDIYGYVEPEPKKEENSRQDELLKKYKYKYYNSLIINIILVAALVIGFLITTNSKNVNILNYENRLLDKYSAWEADLTEREQAVTAREKAMQR